MSEITTQTQQKKPVSMAEPTSWGEKVKQSSLRFSGASYFAADLAFLGRGLSSKPKDWGDIGFGVFFAMGSILLGRYGEMSDERALKLQSEKLANVLEDRLGAIPPESQLAEQKALLEKRSTFDKFEDFMFKYPSQVFGAFVATAAASGIKENFGKKSIEAKWKLGSSGLVMAGALISMFVSEATKQDEAQKKQDDSGKADSGIVNWVKEKPLRSAGVLWASHNFVQAAGMIKSYKKAEHSKLNYKFGASAIGFNLIAAALYAMSSGDHGKRGDKVLGDDKRDAIERMAAEVIATQPIETRDRLLQEVSQAMVTRGGLQTTADVLEQEIREQLNVHLASANAENTRDPKLMPVRDAQLQGRVSEPSVQIK